MRSNSNSYRKGSKPKHPDAYFPVMDVKEADLSLRGQNFNMEVIGLDLLHKAGFLGAGLKVGVVDSGCVQGVTQKSFVKGEKEGDINGHGTHVVSILQEILPKAEIYMAKSMNKSGGGNRMDLLRGTEWLLGQGVKVINGSFAFNADTEVKEYISLIDQGVDEGVIFCFAAGNEGADRVSFPSNRHNVFSVGAINRAFSVTDFSNQGTEIDLVAPGKDILGDSPKGRKVTMSGTSQACPHVTGMLALYVEYMRTQGVEPDFFKAYSDITKGSTLDLGREGFDTAYGYGLIKPYFAGLRDEPQKVTGFFDKLFKWLFS